MTDKQFEELKQLLISQHEKQAKEMDALKRWIKALTEHMRSVMPKKYDNMC